MGKRELQSFRDSSIEYYKNNPDEIPLYLNISFEESEKDGDWGAFLLAVKTIVEARKGFSELAKDLECSRTSLYKTLSENGNPKLETIEKILNQLGYKLTISAIDAE